MNKGVVVTGGNHGIGKQICLDYLRVGYDVCMIDIDSSLDKELVHSNLHFYCGDITKKSVLDDFVSFCKNKMSSIDVIVNNACVGKKGILSDCSYEDFDYVLSIGVKAPYYLVQSFKQQLIESRGNVINIASTRAFQSEPDSEAYASAKGAIVALTHSLAISLSPSVRVNAIAPGWIDVYDTEQFDPIDEQSIPAGRVGKPEDISNMVLYLCSDKGGFITGQTYVIDGGMEKQMIYHDSWNWKYNGK